MESKDKVEVWGGLECTVNRVEDQYFDQFEQSGFFNRAGDAALIASLGITRLRYPILWEHHEPTEHQTINWHITANKLEELRQLGITPIAGLVHHGSGPAFTDLLDADFPLKLAAYAAQVATRFPWIEYYTPVNEPLTTARFSGLYGYWYPHHRNDISFARMLINEVKGIVLSMAAIRKINPQAKLVQTEDLGKTFSTPALAFQARFENERRWLTYDLLCGRLKPGDMMWDYFIRLGIPAADLNFFRENPCIPDLAGFNYYITSERFLTEEIAQYPVETHGGNELQRYADVEAVRVTHGEPWGLKVLLSEAWERFRLPMAVTECQLCCTREEQLRWLKQMYDTSCSLQQEGIPVKAITAWSLFGSYGWNKLLTQQPMNYEAGAFEVFDGKARPTAVAKLIRNIINGNECHPLSGQPGWWQSKQLNGFSDDVPPLLVTGSTGTLGRAIVALCRQRGIKVYAATREDANLDNTHEIGMLIEKVRPWAVVNCAGFVDVDKAETQSSKCYDVNTTAAVLLASACKDYQVKFVTISSDLVFDGEKGTAYIEDDKTNPLNVYGKSKAHAEEQVLFVNPEALIVRTSAFFGPWDKSNFACSVMDALQNGRKLRVADDVIVTPTYVPHLVHEMLDLLIDEERGIWHLANRGAVSWATFAKMIARELGMNESLVVPVSASSMKWVAARPINSALKSSKKSMQPLSAAIEQFIAHLDIKTKSLVATPAHTTKIPG